MSGGYFDHQQFRITDIAESVEGLILSNEEYSEETLIKFREGLYLLNKAAIYAQRIDWLVSGDDGEETFHKRLAKDLIDKT